MWYHHYRSVIAWYGNMKNRGGAVIVMRNFFMLFITLFSIGCFSGCTKRERTIAGVVIGAGIGALVGSAVGNTGGAIAGALLGGTAGGVIGNASGNTPERNDYNNDHSRPDYWEY